MTEKRFTQKDENDWEILDRNKHFAYANSGYQAEKIIQELNELVETNIVLYNDNKQLKQENKKLQGEYDYLLWLYNGLGRGYDWLKDENEQLKQHNTELINKIDFLEQVIDGDV